MLKLHSLFLAVGSFAVFTALTTSQAQAGLLEMIFGVRPAPPPARIENPLEMTIRPRKKLSRPKARHVVRQESEKKPVLATPIDPVANPHWYLSDPTLRRGDIVVLPGMVLVFAGDRGPRRLADFDTLYKTRLVSRKDRERVKLLTEYSRGPVGKYKIVPDTAQIQPTVMGRTDRKLSVILP